MLFLRYRFKFFTCFSKNAAKCLWLWYMNWNKRVRSECRKSHFRGPRFENFSGQDTPGSPYKCEILCMHQSAQELDPPLYVLEVWKRMNLAGGLSCVSLINIGGDLTLSFNSDNIQHVPCDFFPTYFERWSCDGC
jgi:hypothetical protein